MTELVPVQTIPTDEQITLLVGQVWLFQGYALSLAHIADLTPEEAASQFFEGIASGRTSRTIQSEEIANIASGVASFLQVLWGNARVETDGKTWHIQTQLDDQSTEILTRWGVPVGFFGRWMAEVQRREGEMLGIDWDTRLEGDVIHQELRARPR